MLSGRENLPEGSKLCKVDTDQSAPPKGSRDKAMTTLATHMCQDSRAGRRMKCKGSMTHQDSPHGSPTLHFAVPVPLGAALQPQAQFQEIAVSDHKHHKTKTEN